MVQAESIDDIADTAQQELSDTKVGKGKKGAESALENIASQAEMGAKPKKEKDRYRFLKLAAYTNMFQNALTYGPTAYAAGATIPLAGLISVLAMPWGYYSVMWGGKAVDKWLAPYVIRPLDHGIGASYKGITDALRAVYDTGADAAKSVGKYMDNVSVELTPSKN